MSDKDKEEAGSVVEAIEFDNWDDIELAEKRFVRKVDLWVLPFLTIIYILNFVDRAAVGNAKAAGLSTDLDLNDGVNFQIALMVFYISFALVEIPSNIAIQRFGGPWLSLLTFGFGVVTISTAFVTTMAQFIGVRIVLGAIEGGTLAGVTVVSMTTFAWLGFLLGLGPAIAGAFGGLVASAVVSDAPYGSVKTWRKIFLIDGSVTAFFGLLAFVIVPTSPKKARWLSPREKALAELRFRSEYGIKPESQDKIDRRLIRRAFKNPLTWICTAGFAFTSIIIQGVSLFLPVIIAGLGDFTRVEIQLRSVPPYIFASLWSLFITYKCWKEQRHGKWIVFSMIPSCIGYIIFLATTNSIARYVATFFTFAGCVPVAPIFLAWATANTAPETTRSVTSALVPAVGTIGSMISVWAYLPRTQPSYTPGNALNVASCVSAALLALAGIQYVKWENKQRQLGKRDHRFEGLDQYELDTLGSKHPSFRLLE